MSFALLILVLTAEPPPSLAVTDFQAVGAPPELTAAINAVAARELDRLGVFKVTTADTTRSLLTIERQKQLLGCEENCGSAGLELVHVDFVVTGKVTKAGNGFTIELSLIDAKESKRVSAETISASGESEAIDALPAAVLKLVARQLEGRRGGLVVTSSERGAGVKVDGTLIGTTPLPGQSALAAGPHLVEVEKDGFVRSQREVHIAPGEVTENAVTLVPSPDTIGAYQSYQTKLRVGAWTTTALALVGLGLFGGEQLHASDLYTPFQTYKRTLEGGDESVRDRATSLKSQISSAQTIAFVGLGAGLAAAATAVVLWLIGEDPARYDRYRELSR